MTKEFEKDESFSIITERPSGHYPTTEGVDHLTYLEKGASIFAREEDDRMRKWRLVCASCGHFVTKVAEKIEVRGRHNHDFPYYGGVVRLGCYRNAPGCVGIDRISSGYSWFRGYSWQIQLCRHCYIQLGWKYMSDEDSFYGLVFKNLREEKPDEEDGITPPDTQNPHE
ncbi:MAG: cereblon family protein [Desulfatiglandales bacterium]